MDTQYEAFDTEWEERNELSALLAKQEYDCAKCISLRKIGGDPMTIVLQNIDSFTSWVSDVGNQVFEEAKKTLFSLAISAYNEGRPQGDVVLGLIRVLNSSGNLGELIIMIQLEIGYGEYVWAEIAKLKQNAG